MASIGSLIKKVDTEIVDLCVEALRLAAVSHHWHTHTPVWAHHEALGDFYDGMHDLYDDLVEKGNGGGINIPETMPSTTLVFTSYTKALTEIQAFRDKLNQCSSTLCEDEGLEWLAAIIQDHEGKINRIIYKLEQFK